MSEKSHSEIGLHDLHLDDHGHPHRRKVLRRARWIVLAILALLLIGSILTIASRIAQSRSLDRETRARDTIYVTTVTPTADGGASQLGLPGTLQGSVESPIYARSSGYVVHWYKDIGAKVNRGDVLADIDTPEIDQQLTQALANRQQTLASLELAKTSYERWVSLRERDAVAQQELDERHSTYDQARANVAAADAEVGRLQKLEGFKRVVAPFTGIVTQRNIDIGDLIDAGNGGATRELFRMAQADPLRVYVYVPQTYAELVHVGAPVDVVLAEMPGQKFQGKVARTAGAIDVATRTLQTEISLPNPDGRLLPGAYVEVNLSAGGASSLIIPSNAVLFRSEGPRAAVVDANGTAHLQAIRIGREFGQTLEITSGLAATDRIIVNPPDSLIDGEAVTVVEPKAAPSGAASSAPQAGAAEGAPEGVSKGGAPPAPVQPKPPGAPRS